MLWFSQSHIVMYTGSHSTTMTAELMCLAWRRWLSIDIISTTNFSQKNSSSTRKNYKQKTLPWIHEMIVAAQEHAASEISLVKPTAA